MLERGDARGHGVGYGVLRGHVDDGDLVMQRFAVRVVMDMGRERVSRRVSVGGVERRSGGGLSLFDGPGLIDRTEVVVESGGYVGWKSHDDESNDRSKNRTFGGGEVGRFDKDLVASDDGDDGVCDDVGGHAGGKPQRERPRDCKYQGELVSNLVSHY